MVQDTIAVDDYFRRLDEALATAGLATAPDAAADLAAIAGAGGHAAADRSTDADTLIMARPAAAAAESAGDSPKLVDAFSALLAAEEGDGATMVAGPVEMSAAPAPAPAVEWTLGGAKAEAAKAAAVHADPPTVHLQAAAAPAAAFEVVEPLAPAEEMAIELDAAEAVRATGAAAEPVDAPTMHVSPPPPAALRKDVPEHAALEGIDLDVFADAVAQKILHRLTDARIDAIVSERVLEIAERLVREEIERIKADAQ